MDDGFEVEKPGDPRHGQVGELVAMIPGGGGIVRFPDGERGEYESHELRAVIRVPAWPSIRHNEEENDDASRRR
jgi:hypothetical protein